VLLLLLASYGRQTVSLSRLLGEEVEAARRLAAELATPGSATFEAALLVFNHSREKTTAAAVELRNTADDVAVWAEVVRRTGRKG
jgi:hypothetical protein